MAHAPLHCNLAESNRNVASKRKGARVRGKGRMVARKLNMAPAIHLYNTTRAIAYCGRDMEEASVTREYGREYRREGEREGGSTGGREREKEGLSVHII